jgi:hypothetical protein
MLPDPALADPNPQRAKMIPKDQDAFLKAYESRQAEMIAFLKANKLVTLRSNIGRFEIRQLPEAFKPTSPGGSMNAPGVYDKDGCLESMSCGPNRCSACPAYHATPASANGSTIIRHWDDDAFCEQEPRRPHAGPLSEV